MKSNNCISREDALRTLPRVDTATVYCGCDCINNKDGRCTRTNNNIVVTSSGWGGVVAVCEDFVMRREE